MMTADLARALSMIRDAFPRQPFGDRAVRVYAECLADLEGADVLAAVERLIRTASWAPTIGEIRSAVAEDTLRLPTVEEAWDTAMNDGVSPIPEVSLSIRAIGGPWAILHSDKPDTIRAQFRRDYEGRRATAIRRLAGEVRVEPSMLLPPPEPVSLNGRRVAELPDSTRIRPRPVTARMARRYAGHQPLPATTEEKQDAIAILRDGPTTDDPADDPLYREAESIFAEGDQIG